MTLASAPVFARASATVSNTGRPRCVDPPLPGEVPPTILVPYAIAASEWNVLFLPVKPWHMTLVFLSIRTDMVDAASLDDRKLILVDAPIRAGEHVGPSFRVGRELDFHGVVVVVDDFIDVARVAAQRAANEYQRLAAPAAGGRRRRIVAERIVPEQFVEPVLAVVGEHAMGGKALLAIARLHGVLDQIEAVEVDPRLDLRGGLATLGPARGKHHLVAAPLAGKHGELAVFLQCGRCGETVSHR